MPGSETGAHAKDGHGSAAEWLATAAGSSSGVAKSRLVAATRATGDQALTEALHGGDLSSSQLEIDGRDRSGGTGGAKTLLELAETGASHKSWAMPPLGCPLPLGARRPNAPGGPVSMSGVTSVGTSAPRAGSGARSPATRCSGPRWHPGSKHEPEERWKTAGSTDPTTLEAYRLDVFIDVMAGGGFGGRKDGATVSDPDPDPGGRSGSNSGPRVETLVLIDAAALRRGTTQGAEICEIEGIGPVSVAAATGLLGEGGLRSLIKEGFDIKTVTEGPRVVTQCIDMALLVRDRTCVVPGCGRRLGLEHDHVFVDYAKFGPTELKNLVRLCVLHHDLKTHGGWRLTGGPGHWDWIAPLPSPERRAHRPEPQTGRRPGQGHSRAEAQDSPADLEQPRGQRRFADVGPVAT